MKKQGFAAIPKKDHLEYSRRGGATKPTKPRGFAAHPDLARKIAKEKWKKYYAELQKTGGGNSQKDS